MLLTTLSPSSQLPVPIVEGHGARLTDADGRSYWDFYGGHAVTLLGQSHPRWVEALLTQATTLSFVTTVAPVPQRDAAAVKLAEFSGLDRVFFVNSGAEANEAALKVARKATGRPVIVAMEDGFHGRTMACLGVTQAGHYRADHEPTHGEVRFVPFGDAEALAAALDERVAGVLIEPIQGIAGAVPAPPGFLTAARRLCDEHGAVLILDEVQTGVGRTGRPMAWHAEPACRPDLVTVGKSLGGGFPVAALLLTEAMAATAQPGEHGTTFGGGPLAAAVVLAVLETIEDEALLDSALAIEGRVRAAKVPGVVSVQGAGCLLGLVLDQPARPVASALREAGYLVASSNDPRVLRLCPPAVTPLGAVDGLLVALAGACRPTGPALSAGSAT